ncbi:cell division protein CrgA [Ornithinimicrobium avium]|uniref:Cell division protein CrgA n=1 Tax=Ornithinimicrobium avium TaxID=2283195 RepID=A0A345NP46_9MICO|nr:cell division protein CrgA [Ornithinimicrobium avium]AXH96804.1 cell division protein CrgA [Ornithinimicrobium avium]
MPKSRGREGAKQRARRTSEIAPTTQKIPSNPSWFVPVMCALMIVGVLWVATFYVTSGQWPIGSIRYWNLGIGMGMIMAGFMMATRWR